MSDTCRLCPPFGDPWPSCLLPSQNHRMLALAAKSLQSCLTLCNPIDSSPPASTVPGILQARILEWVAIAFSKSQNNTKKKERDSIYTIIYTTYMLYFLTLFFRFSYNSQRITCIDLDRIWLIWILIGVHVTHAPISTRRISITI